MARMDCQFFPGAAALWQCTECQASLGEQAVPDGHSRWWGRNGPRCPACEGSLVYLGSATDAKPFWQMLPHFLLSPMHLRPLLVAMLVGGITLLASGGLLTIFLVIFALAVVTKYSLAIIEHRGRGETTPPSVSDVITADGHHLFLRQMAVFLLMGCAVGVAASVSVAAGMLVNVFIMLAMPASIILLAVEKSVRCALNPFAMTRLMFTIGWSYLLLWLCTQIISLAPVYVIPLLLEVMPEAVVMPVIMMVVVYFVFVLYAMLGYVLFEYQNELGYETLHEAEAVAFPVFEKKRVLGETAVLMQSGQYERARQALRKALDSVRDDIELHERYHKLLVLLNDETALRNHTHYFVDLVERQHCLAKAIPVLLDVQKKYPDFQLQQSQQALTLAQLLMVHGHYKAVIRLFHNRHKTQPNDPLLPEAYLLIAGIFHERMGDDATATALLNFIVKRYPDAAACEQTLRLRQQLQAIKRP